MHNYLQESFSRMVEFKGLGSILGYLEVISVMVFSSFERWLVGETGRKVARSDYMQLTACLFGTSYLSTVGLDYISYPTKVVFRSCKLIPTMAVAFCYNSERFSFTDIWCAVAICAGISFTTSFTTSFTLFVSLNHVLQAWRCSLLRTCLLL